MLPDTRIWEMSGMQVSRQWPVQFQLDRRQYLRIMREAMANHSETVSHKDFMERKSSLKVFRPIRNFVLSMKGTYGLPDSDRTQ
jgi:hypothetical protein